MGRFEAFGHRPRCDGEFVERLQLTFHQSDKWRIPGPAARRPTCSLQQRLPRPSRGQKGVELDSLFASALTPVYSENNGCACLSAAQRRRDGTQVGGERTG